MSTYDDNQKATKAHCRSAFSAQPQRFFLPLLVRLHGSTDTTARKSAIIECHAPFYFFSAKMFARLTLQFLFTYICICNRVRSVSLSSLGLRDRDIIFRDETDLVFSIVSLAAWLSFRYAKLTAGGEGWVRILAIECVGFSPSYRFSIFSRSNAHTHTNKEGAKTRRKAERRQRAVRFTRFLDYRLMFDSGRSFSLQYFLIRLPY